MQNSGLKLSYVVAKRFTYQPSKLWGSTITHFVCVCVCVCVSISVCALACSFDYITHAIIIETIQYIKKWMNH